MKQTTVEFTQEFPTSALSYTVELHGLRKVWARIRRKPWRWEHTFKEPEWSNHTITISPNRKLTPGNPRWTGLWSPETGWVQKFEDGSA